MSSDGPSVVFRRPEKTNNIIATPYRRSAPAANMQPQQAAAVVSHRPVVLSQSTESIITIFTFNHYEHIVLWYNVVVST